MDILRDVGKHEGSWGKGHYEAHVYSEKVVITTELDNAKHAYTVSLRFAEWDRLVAWIDWQRKKDLSSL